MSQRTRKVEELVRQIVATNLIGLLSKALAPVVTVTAVEVSPDLRNATVWIGVLDSNQAQAVASELESVRPELQAAVAGAMTTKFVPKLHLRLDSSGAYAAEIEAIIRKL